MAICCDVVLEATGTEGSTTLPSGVETASDVRTWATLNVTFDRIEPEVARRLYAPALFTVATTLLPSVVKLAIPPLADMITCHEIPGGEIIG